MRLICCYLQFHVCLEHTKPRGNLHALTLLSVLHTMRDTREFVIRREIPNHSATSSSDTRTTPTLACVTGQNHRPELTLCSSHAGNEFMLLRPRPPTTLPREKKAVSGRSQIRKHERTYEATRTASCTSSRSTGCLSACCAATKAPEEGALKSKISHVSTHLRASDDAYKATGTSCLSTSCAASKSTKKCALKSQIVSRKLLIQCGRDWDWDRARVRLRVRTLTRTLLRQGRTLADHLRCRTPRVRTHRGSVK